jgi:hypothetical protein
LTGKTRLFLVDLNGSIDSQLQGEWDHYYDVIIQIKPINESAKSDEKVITTAEPAELFTTIETSNAFDGRYSFDLFRYSDDEGDRKVGSGFVDINNGEVIIDKDNSDLKTGSNELYDTFSGQVNKKGKVSASMTLDVLNGKDAPEFYEFNGSIKDKKIWGETAFENSFKAYMLIAEESKSSPLFDGRYSFTISRYHDDEDWKELGSGFIQIKNGIMTVAKEGRTLDTGSIDLYDSFAGQIDKEGNIMSSLRINVLTGKTRLFLVDLNGSIDSQLQGKWDNYFDVILKLGKKE